VFARELLPLLLLLLLLLSSFIDDSNSNFSFFDKLVRPKEEGRKSSALLPVTSPK